MVQKYPLLLKLLRPSLKKLRQACFVIWGWESRTCGCIFWTIMIALCLIITHFLRTVFHPVGVTDNTYGVCMICTWWCSCFNSFLFYRFSRDILKNATSRGWSQNISSLWNCSDRPKNFTRRTYITWGNFVILRWGSRICGSYFWTDLTVLYFTITPIVVATFHPVGSTW